MEKVAMGAVAGGAPDYLDLAETIDVDRERLGMTCMRPFIDVLSRLKRDVHGFGADDVRRALGCWIAFDNDEDWDGGFLVELIDGRRVELDILAPAFEFGDEMKISIEFQAANFNWRDVPRNHPVSGYGWVEELPEIDALLHAVAVARIAATSHVHSSPPLAH